MEILSLHQGCLLALIDKPVNAKSTHPTIEREMRSPRCSTCGRKHYGLPAF